jgi:hypothetical protein
MTGALGQLLDVQVSVLGKLPHRLRRVRQERRCGTQQSLVPSEGTLIVTHREAREEIDRHMPTLPVAA